MGKRSLVFFVVFYLSFTSLFGHFRTNNFGGSIKVFWNTRNTLPSDRILDIIQDKRGYIWIASYDGLIRFNGKKFVNFSKLKIGLDVISPRVLQKDKEGGIWIGTNSNGVYRFDNHKFTSYTLKDGLPSLSVRAISYDSSGRLWIGTIKGVAYFEGGRFHAISSKEVDLDNITFLISIKDGLLAGSNLSGLRLIKDGKISYYEKIKSLRNYDFYSAYLDPSGFLYLGSSSGKIFKIKDDELIKVFDFEELRDVRINKFLRTKSGNLYIGTDSGLVKIEYGKNGEKLGEHILKDKIISQLLEDYEENFWVGTEHTGIVKFTKGKFLDLSEANNLKAEFTNAVFEDEDNNLWIGGDKGAVCIFDEDLDPNRKKSIQAILQKLSGIRIRQIREEKDGTLVFATYSKYGLLSFTKNGKISTISQKDGLPNNKVRFSYRDKNNILWIATNAGPALSYKGKLLRLDKKNGLENLFILSCIEDKDGNILLGSDGGGAAKIETKKLKSYFDSMDVAQIKEKIKVSKIYTKKDGLNGNVMLKIVKDEQERLWFCTGEGLNFFEHEKFYDANPSLKIGKQSVFNILKGKNNNFWIITPKEIVFINANKLIKAIKEKKPITKEERYSVLDGFSGQLAANSWGHVGENCEIFIPTLRGVSVCKSNYVITSDFSPPLIIESYTLDDEEANHIKDDFVVSADVKRIRFDFAALSYVAPQKIRCEYRLRGYNSKWSLSGLNNSVSYTNLNPGNYTFEVRLKDKHQSTRSISFYKKPYFYQTIWFYASFAFFVGFLIFLAFSYKLKRVKKQALELDFKVKEKTKELESEKKKVDELLQNTLPSFIIDEFTNTGKSQPKTYPDVSILVVDLVNFTSWASKQEPKTVISILNNLFTHFDKIMDKYSCERIKTIGDGYMACCGLQNETNHAIKIAQAGLEILESMDYINKQKNTDFQIRIAMDSGVATGGIVGVRKYVFDVFGDVVNTVFRLEEISTPNSFTVSKHSARLIKDKFNLYKRPQRNIKGKGMLDSFYINHKNIDTKDLKKQYDSILFDYENKNFVSCKAKMRSFDASLLEPECFVELALIQKELNF